MSRDTVHLFASLLLLAAFVMLVIGLGGQADLLWQLGLGVIAVAMCFSVATRWVGAEEEEADEEPGPHEELAGAEMERARDAEGAAAPKHHGKDEESADSQAGKHDEDDGKK